MEKASANKTKAMSNATKAEMAINTANSIANMQMMGAASRANQSTQTMGKIAGGTAEAGNKAVGAMGKAVSS